MEEANKAHDKSYEYKESIRVKLESAEEDLLQKALKVVEAEKLVKTITAEGVQQRSLLHDIMTMSPDALGEESLADFGTAFEVNPDEVDQEAIDQAKKAKQAMIHDFQQRTGEFLTNLKTHWDIAKSKAAEERVALVQAAKKRKQEAPGGATATGEAAKAPTPTEGAPPTPATASQAKGGDKGPEAPGSAGSAGAARAASSPAAKEAVLEQLRQQQAAKPSAAKVAA